MTKGVVSKTLALCLLMIFLVFGVSEARAGLSMDNLNIGATANIFLKSSGNGFFVFETTKTEINYNFVSKDGSFLYETVSHGSFANGACVFGDSLYMSFAQLGDESSGFVTRDMTVMRQDSNGNRYEICAIANYDLKSKYCFAVSKNIDFIFTTKSNKADVYSSNGKLKYSITADSHIYQLITNPSGTTLYLMTDNGMYSTSATSNTGLSQVSGAFPQFPVSFINADYIIDSIGDVFYLNSNYLTAVYSSGVNAVVPGAGISGGLLYISKDLGVFAVDLKTGEEKYKYILGSQIDSIAINGSTVAAFCDGEDRLFVLDTGEFEKVVKETEPPPTAEPTKPTKPPKNTENTTKSTQATEKPKEKKFSLGNISTDSRSGALVISRGKTVAAVKKDLDYNGYSIVFYKADGTVYKSGAAGTGMIMQVIDDETGSIQEYTLLVMGDVTGEGNINSRDTKALMSHLLLEESLQGIFLRAADMDSNDLINAADLVAMAKAVQ